MNYPDATPEQIDEVMNKAWEAFYIFRNKSPKERASFMRMVASEIQSLGDSLLDAAGKETNLPVERLRGERGRTIFQLTTYADACEKGEWLELRIDKATEVNPARPDLRKMNVALGPVVVFGASNFPFAYSTAGGDTASAFAAGCPVIVKAHPAHPETSELVAGAIKEAIKKSNLPEGVFGHLHGGVPVGKALVNHKFTKAVGFTGSFAGGKALFDWANQRKKPIPVFAEMGSINPVFLLPGKLENSATEIAAKLASSITLGVGQFCTNPGLIIAKEGPGLQEFIAALGNEISKVQPGRMLHSGIAVNYKEKKNMALAQTDVETIAVADTLHEDGYGLATIATASAKAYLSNPVLQEEVFGPYSLIIRCASIDEMIAVANHTEGQLTATLFATNSDITDNAELVELIKDLCGRFILNGVPTGVEVSVAMQHGGPFPATTDSRFTSVGADAIKRFVRPVCFQNWPVELLPAELRDESQAF